MPTKTLCTLLCLLLLGSSNASRVATAQDGEDIVKGLLRALIERQLEKSGRGRGNQPDPLRDPNGRNGLRPGRVTPEMQQLRPVIAGFAQESTTLTALMNSSAAGNFEVRRHLPAALQLEATAIALNQQSSAQGNHLVLLDGYRGLSSEFRTLSHQLEQCRSINIQARACVQRLSALDQQYCSILGIQEQFDNTQLVREAWSLASHLRNLADDLSNQAPPPPGSHGSLRSEAASLAQRADYFANLVSRGMQFQTVASQYQDLYKSWLSLQTGLSGYPGYSIARNVRRIQESNRSIHELLRLEMGIDPSVVLQLVHNVQTELAGLFRSITLEELMSLPDGDVLVAAADAVNGNFQNLDDLVHRGESPQAVTEAWVYTDEAWNMFAYYVAPIQNPQTHASLRSIRQSMESLKHTMGVTTTFDRSALVQSASSLEQIASTLVTAIERWHSHPGKHNRNILSQARSLVNQCHSLEQLLTTVSNENRYRRECDQVIKTWQQIRPELKKCDTDERETIDYVVSTFTPELVRLRTMLGD